MKYLQKPNIENSPEEIFGICVSSYQDENRRKKLLSCKDIVKLDSDNYEYQVPAHIDEFHASELPKEVSAKEMVEVYESKFARRDSPGRTIYDQIMLHPKLKICPICGVRQVSTLDHYLPKSRVPTLSVTPNNLIPACYECNIRKGTSISIDPSQTPLHAYFDIDLEIDIPWLYAEIGQSLEVTYSVRCPKAWSPEFQSRAKEHFRFFELNDLYSSQAAVEVAGMTDCWRSLFQSDCGGAQLREHFQRVKKSQEKIDMNSWRAALYRGLIENMDIVTDFLKNIPKE